MFSEQKFDNMNNKLLRSIFPEEIVLDIESEDKVKEIKEVSFNIEKGLYYFAELLKSNDAVFTIHRYEVNEEGLISYMRASRNWIDIHNFNRETKDSHGRQLLKLLGKIEDTYSSYISYWNTIDSDFFARYYNEFYSQIVPFVL